MIKLTHADKMNPVTPITIAWPTYSISFLWLNLRFILFVLHLYYRLRFVLALQDLNPNDLAVDHVVTNLVAVTFAEVVIQMLLILEVFNSAAVIA